MIEEKMVFIALGGAFIALVFAIYAYITTHGDRKKNKEKHA